MSRSACLQPPTAGISDVLYATRAVANVAVGGSVRVASRLTAHGGFFTDRSPVKDEAQVFAPLNLMGFTTGTNISAGPLSGSVGIAYMWGQRTIDLVAPTGITLQPQLKVSALDILFALSYKF